jgi:hypothetical protein
MSDRAHDADEPLYAIPSGQPLDLALAPRKTSWDAGTSTSQIELGRYLDHVTAVAAPWLHELTGPLALRLDVGLPAGIDPLFEHDLDNFLHPVVKQLGGRPFVSAWATKAPGARSHLRIAPAEPTPPEAGWQRWPGRTTASTARERQWKDQVKAALAGTTELPAGPVGLQISLTVSPERSWPNLWKMVIDALDPVVGRSFPDDEYDPRDGRVVRLGIHVREDASVGWEVPFVIRARPADLAWPEMAWFAAMSTAKRAEWLAEHERRCAPNRRSRRGARSRPGSPVAGTPGHTAREHPGVVPVLPASGSGVPQRRISAAAAPILELTSMDDFRTAVGNGDLVVITDSAKPAKLHPAAARCSGVTEDNFRGKVIERGGRGGKYFTVPSETVARERWPRLTLCGTCG